jgi:hypothetical protein
MLARLFAFAAALSSLNVTAIADDSYNLGNASFSVPPGWTQVDSSDTRSTYASPDGRQQLTISTLHLAKAPSFEDFELLCQHRYAAERNGVKDLVLIPPEPIPHNDKGDFTLTFSGEENPRSRVFDGFLWIKGDQLITIYVEGIGVAADRNSDAFHEIVKSLR